MATPETRRQLLAAVAACDDKKGEDTRILELDPADSGLADFFLITSASNDRQVVAIADEIEFRLKKDFGLYATSVEGRRQAEWILLDYVDIVIHVFLQEKRAFYDIERLRKSARPLTSAEIEAELKAELAKKTRAVRGNTPAKKAVSKSPATKAQKPKAPSVNPTPQGDSKVTAKPAKKAKPGKEAKPAAKKAAKPTASKPAAKKAAVNSAAKPVAALAPAAVRGSGRSAGKSAPTNLGAKPPIVKAQASIGAVGVKAPTTFTKGAQPPIVKCEPPPEASISVAASAAPQKAAKKAAKAPLKQAIRKGSR